MLAPIESADLPVFEANVNNKASTARFGQARTIWLFRFLIMEDLRSLENALEGMRNRHGAQVYPISPRLGWSLREQPFSSCRAGPGLKQWLEDHQRGYLLAERRMAKSI